MNPGIQVLSKDAQATPSAIHLIGRALPRAQGKPSASAARGRARDDRARLARAVRWLARNACAILREVDPESGPRLRGLQAPSRKDLRELTASLLEAAGPLTLLGAQAIYLAEPFFPARKEDLRAWARVLEDPAKFREWVRARGDESGP